MTQHEQKPESAEFRTLETQVSECARDLRASLIALEEKLYVEFAEAADRGAADQRRKDAEGAEPVAWLISDRLKGKPGCAHIVDRTTTNRTYAEYQATLGFDVTPLCSKGSNVAALEDRVKELEAEVERLKKPELFVEGEDAYLSPKEALESYDPDRFQVIRMTGFAPAGFIWAFSDGENVHEFSTEEAARAAAIRERGKHG